MNTVVQEHRQQEEREQAFQRRAIGSAILDAAEERWREEREFGGDVDPVARTVTVGSFNSDDTTTYRYGFDAEGNLLLWNEEEGEEPPAELTDDADAPASCEGCRSSGLSEAESRAIHNN
jgi:hypothetical protein